LVTTPHAAYVRGTAGFPLAADDLVRHKERMRWATSSGPGKRCRPPTFERRLQNPLLMETVKD